MPTIKDVDKLIINKVESKEVYQYMEDNNLIQEDELYLVGGEAESSLPKVTESDNGKVLGVVSGQWGVVNQTSPLTPGTDYLTPTQISQSYVAKETNKGLSTNDLTDTLKSNYDTAYTHSQSSHAPANAEQNVQSDWNVTDNTSDAYILNKPTTISGYGITDANIKDNTITLGSNSLSFSEYTMEEITTLWDEVMA